MYIVSKFHDYYDSVMRLGMDKTVIYNRNTLNVKVPDKIRQKPLYDLFEKLPHGSHDNVSHWITLPYVLLICGEAIPLIQFKHQQYGMFTFYSAHKAIDFALAKRISFFKYWSFWGSHSVNTINGIKHFFDDKQFAGLTRLHELYNCPIILCEHPKVGWALTLNPNLRELGYQTQKDPYTLFQTIYMFISGVLGTPEKEPRPVSDKIKAANHGHDGEYSFKNVPGKKRGRNNG